MNPSFQLAFLDPLSSTLRNIHEGAPSLNAGLLLASILVPLLAALVLMALSGRSPVLVRAVARIGFAIPALIALWLTASYLSLGLDGRYAFMLRQPLGLEFLGIEFFIGLNGISLPLFLMAGIVGLAAGIYAIQSGVEKLRFYLVLLLIMHGGLMGVFSSIDIFFFYFFHEFALIPTFILIAFWGRAGRKTVAIELTVYLTLGAMITLAGLLSLYFLSGAEAFNMIALRNAIMDSAWQGTVFGLLLVGFGILVSLFPFHSWAPRGYATAPAPAAMLHAGVLKKFGLYGLIQLAWPLLPTGAELWSPLLLWLAFGNIVLIGLVTMAQRDLKLMLGNASVMHMGYAFLGLYAYSVIGVGGAVLMLFAHGLSVALLFLLADSIEKRTGTADMDELGGLGKQAPVLMGFFVAAIMASIGLPGFANFWGELSIFVALFQSATPWAIAPAVLGIVISAIYGLRAVASIFFGDSGEAIEGGDLTRCEKVPAILLLASLLIVGFWPKTLSDSLDAAVQESFAVQAAHAERSEVRAVEALSQLRYDEESIVKTNF
ncbi:MAG: NADH-quinone oxidoreductase subunit M [Opitutales bacterium]|nr:NADH-quinone oxidoreductase subunit M [Opitutales bacterium]